MTSLELLSYLRSRDVTLWVEGDRLRYSAPSGVITPDLRDELGKHKDELLAFLPKTDSTNGFTRPPIRPIPRQAEYLASFSQWRLWFVDRLSPSPVYTSGNCMRLTGPLNVAALEQSLNEIVRRHEALRTTLSEVGDRLLQVITPHSTTRLTISDLRGITEPAE